MWALLGAALARPLFVLEGPETFRIVDHTGQNVSAWHFAHETHDHELVRRLRPVVYGRRLGVLVSLGGGAAAFASGVAYVTQNREPSPRAITVEADLAAAGALAAGGALLFTAGTLSIVLHRPRTLRVDQHYTADEADLRLRVR